MTNGTPRIVYTSQARVIHVTDTDVVPEMRVRGARGRAGPHYYGHPALLVASHADAEWTYAGLQGSAVRGSTFLDTRPDLALDVTVPGNGATVRRRVRPVNVIGAYNTDQTFVGGGIVQDDGWLHPLETLRSLGTVQPPALSNVDYLCATTKSIAARCKDGLVQAWGDEASGGGLPGGLAGVVRLAASGRAFAAVLADGTVRTWGDASAGGAIPEALATSLKIVGVDSIVGADAAFAVRDNPGDVWEWGTEKQGYRRIRDAAHAEQIVASNTGFAARLASGDVITWDAGSDTPTRRQDGAGFLSSTARAFCALRPDGTVQAWGESGFGGSSPQVNDVRFVVGTNAAFAALHANGTVTAWGDASNGGAVPDELSAMRAANAPQQAMVVSLTSGWGTFVALLEDGGCISWGRIQGRSRPESKVTAAYVVGNNVIALTASGEIDGWGNDVPDLSSLMVTHSY